MKWMSEHQWHTGFESQMSDKWHRTRVCSDPFFGGGAMASCSQTEMDLGFVKCWGLPGGKLVVP